MLRSQTQICTSTLRALELNYKKSTYFQETYSFIKNVFQMQTNSLSQFNISLIKQLVKHLGIKKTKFYTSSELHITGKDPTERLLNICNYFNATHYLTGASATNYLDEKKFINNNISLEYQNYNHPTYRQLWGSFIPYLSVIDLLFNEGKQSLKILSNN